MGPVEVGIAAVAAAGILLIVFAVFASQPDPVRARLDQLGRLSGGARNLEELELRQPFLERTFRPIAARLTGATRRLTSASFDARTAHRLATAGSPFALSVADWLAVKVLAGVLLAGAFVLASLLLKASGTTILIFAVAGLGIGYIAPEFWLGRRVRTRQERILEMIPDSLDLLTISVRAGLGFDAALTKVVEQVEGPLSDEFRRALAEVRVGRPRRDALHDIMARTEVAPLNSFIGAVIQAERLGVPISKVLQVQSEQLRVERRQRAEELAAQAPVKMLLPLVGCVFPSLFIVILGPALILLTINF